MCHHVGGHVTQSLTQVIEQPVPLEHVRAHLVDDFDTAAELLRWLSTKDRVAFDTETTGLDKRLDRPRLFQVGDVNEGWAVPVGTWTGLIQEIFRRFRGQWDAHNLPFDAAMVSHLGIEFPRHRAGDTRLAAHVLDSTGSLALKAIADRVVDPRASLMQAQLDTAMHAQGWDWETVPVDFPLYWGYGAMDTVLTARVEEYQRPRVAAEAPAAYQLELGVSWPCDAMETHGVPVDLDYATELTTELDTYVAEAEAWCREHYGLHPGSNQDVVAALRRDGVEFTRLTDGGAVCLDQDVLSAIDHPLASTVLARRKAERVVGTYLRSYTELERDGLIHPSINTVGGTDKNPFEPGGKGSGVRTSRMSCSRPNLQNVPVRTAMGRRLRSCFVARPGYVWVKADFSQIEMRILAHLSNDQAMIRAFCEDGDFHLNVAREIYQDPELMKSDPRRGVAKNAGFAKIYAAGPDRFAQTAHVDISMAQEFMRNFDIRFPDTARWIKQVERDARHRYATEGQAYARSELTGRKHTVAHYKLYPLVNYIIQGMAGEILKMKICEADAAGLGPWMMLPVHDEINLEVPEADVPDVLATLREIMFDDQLLRVPIEAEIGVGPRWGECKEVVW